MFIGFTDTKLLCQIAIKFLNVYSPFPFVVVNWQQFADQHWSAPFFAEHSVAGCQRLGLSGPDCWFCHFSAV